MKIDSYDRNLVTGGARFPVDESPLPLDPVYAGEVDFSILVHEDLVDYDYAWRTEGAGLPPLFGRDGIEVPPPAGFEPGLDGEALRAAGLAAVGIQADALEIAGAPAPVQPFTLGTIDRDDMVGASAFAPYLDPLAFLSDDGLDIRAALANPQAPPPIGEDGLDSGEPDWNARAPQPGAGSDEVVAAGGSPWPAGQFADPRDGIELPRRPERRLVA